MMVSAPIVTEHGDPARMMRLEHELDKLQRINRALINRVERSMDSQGSAFSMFQTAITLEGQVRDRTAALATTLTALKSALADSARAREEAEAARANLLAAISSGSEGFALFDSNDRIVLYNERYLDFWPGLEKIIHEGMTFTELVWECAENGRVLHAIHEPEEWIRRRLAQHAACDGAYVHALTDGRWVQISEQRTASGGIVAIYTDITALKRRETELREAELAAKSALLQATLDTILEGVGVYDRDLTLVAWNNEFVRLLDLPANCYRAGASFADFRAFDRSQRGLGVTAARSFDGDRLDQPVEFELTSQAGRVLRIQRMPMAEGGFVLTFADITPAKQTEAALRVSQTALIRINESLEQRVEERTRKLEAEITERREVEQALEAAKTVAEKANVSKTRFLAAVSHDLLQPLNAARLFVSALLGQDYPDRLKGLIGNIDHSLGAVESLLDALLDICRLDVGTIEPELISFPVADLLKGVVTEHQPMAAEKGLELRYVPCSATVRSDWRYLRRIIQNLLSNALRYTDKGRVLLGCRPVEGGIRIEVWDTGRGIPADKLDDIFEEFRQLRTGGASRHVGLGLGLAIVKRAATMLGLPVGVRSTPGKGSVFWVTVPLGEAPAITAPATVPADIPLDGRRILVIDNEISILAGMEALLQGWRAVAYLAASEDEAVELLAEVPEPPELIVADYHLDDGATGLEAIDRVEQALGCKLPAIVVTADRSEETRDRIAARGCRAMSKPVNPAELSALLSQLLP
jgi:signal transduction histidine kinase